MLINVMCTHPRTESLCVSVAQTYIKSDKAYAN